MRRQRQTSPVVRTHAVAQGQRLARIIFQKRAKGGRVNVEAHMSELELAAALAVAVETGAAIPKPLIRELLEYFCAECLCHEWTTDGGKPGRCIRCRARDYLGDK